MNGRTDFFFNIERKQSRSMTGNSRTKNETWQAAKQRRKSQWVKGDTRNGNKRLGITERDKENRGSECREKGDRKGDGERKKRGEIAN